MKIKEGLYVDCSDLVAAEVFCSLCANQGIHFEDGSSVRNKFNTFKDTTRVLFVMESLIKEDLRAFRLPTYEGLDCPTSYVNEDIVWEEFKPFGDENE
jgi:hypothetical protein